MADNYYEELDIDEDDLLEKAIQEELSITPIQRRIEKIVTNGLGYIEDSTRPDVGTNTYRDAKGIVRFLDTFDSLNLHLQNMDSITSGKGPIFPPRQLVNSLFLHMIGQYPGQRGY